VFVVSWVSFACYCGYRAFKGAVGKTAALFWDDLALEVEVKRKLVQDGLHVKVCQQGAGLLSLEVNDCHKYMYCPKCAKALEIIMGGSLGPALAKHWGKLGASRIPHRCPFSGGDDLFPLAAAFAFYMRMWEVTGFRKDFVSEGTKDVELPEGKYNKKSGKEWKRTRVANRQYSRKVFATDDYEYLQDLLDAGLDTQAFEELVDTLADDDLRAAEDDYDDAGGDDPRALAHFHDVRRSIQQRTAQSAKGLFAKMVASRNARRRPEGAIPKKTLVGSLPEGPKKPTRLVCFDEFALVPESEATLMQREFLEECSKSHALHEKVYAEYANKTQECLTAEAAVVELRNVIRTTEGVPAAKKKPRKRRAKTNGATQALVEERKSLPESVSRGSVLLDYTELGVRALAFEDVRFRGGLLNGLLFRGEAGKTYFVTCRHIIVNLVAVDRFAVWNQEKLKAKCYSPNGAVCDVVVEDLLSNGDDRVVFVVSGANAKGKNPKVGDPVVYKGQGNGPTPPLVHFTCAIEQDGIVVWQNNAGPIMLVSPDGERFFYAATTTSGCCRMPVFTSSGQILGGHYHPGLSIAGVVCPGSERERLQIPKGFERRYTPPKIDAEGLPQGEQMLECVARERSGRVEKFKMYPLKPKAGMVGVNPRYFLAKPSTEMLHDELQKFAGDITYNVPEDIFRKAETLAIRMDGPSATLYTEPTLEDFSAVVLELGRKTGTSAGASADGCTQFDYVCAFSQFDDDAEGVTDEVRFLDGVECYSRTIFELYRCIADGREVPEHLRDMYLSCFIWNVQGKKDGYKLKKLYMGRSIQCPCFEQKVMWKVVMGRGDGVWNKMDTHFRVGFDFNRPVPPHHDAHYLRARAVLAFDETAFDRRVPRQMLESFFRRYLPVMCLGVPNPFLRFLADATIDSFLKMTDGTIYQKHRGNPSGFMNTLRLNCYLQCLVWCCIIFLRLDEMGVDATVDEVFEMFGKADEAEADVRHFFIEMCGDDSRVFVNSKFGELLFDTANGGDAVLRLWKECFPWEVKVEGLVVYNGTEDLHRRVATIPPFIGRQVVVMDGYLWTPISCPSRTVKRLVHVEDRSAELQVELETAAWATLVQHLYWSEMDLLTCPTADWVRGFRMKKMFIHKLMSKYNMHAAAYCRKAQSVFDGWLKSEEPGPCC